MNLNKKKVRPLAVLSLSVFLILTAVCAYGADEGSVKVNLTAVNQEVLPDEGALRPVRLPDVEGIEKGESTLVEYSSYEEAQEALDLSLLTSALADDAGFQTVWLDTDKIDTARLFVTNYIVGAGAEYEFIEEFPPVGRYQAVAGDELYGAGIDLEIRMALSEEQSERGIGVEFLGNYRYIETYTDEQGRRVNLIGTVNAEPDTDSEGLDVNSSETVADGSADGTSRLIAVFVDDGVQYQVSGIVSVDTMKMIVASFADE